MGKQEDIQNLLVEDRVFAPPPAFREKANIQDENIWEKAAADPEAYWAGWAEKLHWFKKWDTVLDWQAPYAKWFVGGKTNVSYNCLDRHLDTPTANKNAILWEGEPGDKRTFTYAELHAAVSKFASVLKKQGLKKGDRVAIYMPMVPELAIAMLACARIGAVHSVIFAGFSAESIRDRVDDSECVMVITADGGYRRGKVLALKEIVDTALEGCESVKNVIVWKRDAEVEVTMQEGRDYWWHDLVAATDESCAAEEMDAEDMLFILYTSGTTGKPKGIIHTTGGYMVGTYATSQWVFDLKDDDIFWCTADCGWVTGHSYVVYGPMANGATCLMYEGSPDFPEKDRFWDLVESYGVTILYTAPTAIRAFMKWGEEYPEKHDLSSLRLLGSVGEPINPEAWMWYNKVIGGERCPVVDTWWQTETGGIMISDLPGISTAKPGHAGRPFPGIEVKVLDENRQEVAPGTGGGYVCITKPWPSMLRGIWGDKERYLETYWSKWENDLTYLAGDGGRQDADGRFLFLGRVDDVLSVSGHRIGTSEVESALVDHHAVAEAAVVGKHHDIKGQCISAFVILRGTAEGNDELVKELKQHVVEKIGAIARPEQIIFVADVPKTRSGKIMRRLLKDIAEGKVIGDTTTLADASIVEKLKGQYGDKEG